MKCDMAGAAAILGFFRAIGEIKPDLPIVAILPCADNMPDSNATRPGEVVTSFSGKTIEILNTDAEGRLLLCDALAYSAQYEPAAIIDLATLTGGCIVAFGWNVAAVMDNSPMMQNLVIDAGMNVGERFWPMPLWDIYKEELKSEVADLKNIGSREGMTIHAGMFLKEFVPEDTPWAHLDIAGPAWRKKRLPQVQPEEPDSACAHWWRFQRVLIWKICRQYFILQSMHIHASFIFCDALNRNGKITWFIKNLIFKLIGARTWQKHLPVIFWLVMKKPVWT